MLKRGAGNRPPQMFFLFRILQTYLAIDEELRMKTRQGTGYFQQAYMILLLCLVSSIVSAGSAFALTGNNIDQCYDCHGGSGDIRPLDTPATSPASYRNITTGNFKGNHRSHMSAVT